MFGYMWAPPANLSEELKQSSAFFLQLYDQSRSHLQTVLAHNVQEETSKNMLIRSVFGGLLGAASGTIMGGVLGALGGVTAITCQKFCSNINAVGATLGFAGSVLGGAVGGVFTGSVGGAVCAEGAFKGSACDTAWFAIGFATGGAIGGIFGGKVGAAGGAVGGAIGGLQATRIAPAVVGFVEHFGGKKDSHGQTSKIKKAAEGFQVKIKPLLEQLKKIKTISEKMTSNAAAQRVAAQARTTLVAVTAMEEAISDPQRGRDPTLMADETATLCRNIMEELDRMKTELQKLLVALRP